MAATVISSLVFPVVYRGSLSYFLPSANASLEATDNLIWLLFEASVVVTLVGALLVGYLFRRRYEYPLRGIFLTSAAVSFLVVLTVWLIKAAPVLGNLQATDSVAASVYMIVVAAVVGIILAALVTVGAAIRSYVQ